LTEDLSGLLFNLASDDRLALLSEISARKQRLTTLSKTINASAQECSRHLARLTDTGFIQKDSECLYEITPLGKAIRSIFPGMEFLLKYKPFFLTHDLSLLPPSFVERIGDLAGGEYVNHISLVLGHIKTVIGNGKEFVWLISDQPIVVGTVGSSFSSPNVPVRLIGDETIDRNIVVQLKAALARSEVGIFRDVRVAMAINETIAGICFPGIDGKIDFSAGFLGKDPSFRGWCNDLFKYYWSRSRKIMLT
jgi:predicted transcriptional regulator